MILKNIVNDFNKNNIIFNIKIELTLSKNP